MFPHRRTPLVEWLYVLCFVSTRLIYVALLWHEVYFNYPDKSVAFLYSITISLHIYWFVLYLQTQKRFRAKQRSKQLETVLQSLANTAKAEYVASIAGTAKMVMGALKDEFRTNDCLNLSTVTTVTTKRRRLSSRMVEADRQWYEKNENRVSVELSEKEQQRPLIARDLPSRGGAQVV
jgi:signal transduction histidine kinase